MAEATEDLYNNYPYNPLQTASDCDDDDTAGRKLATPNDEDDARQPTRSTSNSSTRTTRAPTPPCLAHCLIRRAIGKPDSIAPRGLYKWPCFLSITS